MKNLLYFTFLLILISPSFLMAQPINDNCSNATVLSFGGVCFDATTNADIRGATGESNIPVASCFFEGQEFKDIWFSFTAPTSGVLDFYLKEGTGLDMVFYEGSCTNLLEDTCIFVNTPMFSITRNFTAGGNYLLQINNSINDVDTFCLQIIEPGGAGTLPNDVCSGAISLPVGTLCNGVIFNADNRFAKDEGVYPAASCNYEQFAGGLADIWFSFVAPSSGQVVINVDEEGLSAISDLSVYSGGCNNLQEWDCPFVFTAETSEEVVTGLIPNEVYYLRAATFDGNEGKEFCLQIREEIGYETLDYSAAVIGSGADGDPTILFYDNETTPTPLEINETLVCNKDMFARVEPAGVIKLKAVSPYCVDNSSGLGAATGNWVLREYQLRGLVADSVPVTFTFEFSGSVDVLPDWIGCDGHSGTTGASFDANIYFYESGVDTAFTDESSVSIYYSWVNAPQGYKNSLYDINNVTVNTGTIRIQPAMLVNGDLVDIRSVLPDFIQDYNNLSTADRNNPTLALSEVFLSAIQDSFDLTRWDTIHQKAIESERSNFFNALNHLNYGVVIGYNPTTAQFGDLRFKTKINFAYNKEVTVLINNKNLINNPRLSLSFGAGVSADNLCNSHTAMTDFTNTAKLVNIAVPAEFIMPNANPTLSVTSEISIPIEGTGCNDTSLTLINTPLVSGIYSTPETINSASIISSGTDVTFISPKNISLTSDFYAQTGSQFLAKIEDVASCNDNLSESPMTVTARATTSIPKAFSIIGGIIPEFQLDIFPNPFNQQTTINYVLPKADKVNLQIVDLLGKQVAVLEKKVLKDKGSHSFIYQPRFLESGTYFIVLECAGRAEVQKFIFVKN